MKNRNVPIFTLTGLLLAGVSDVFAQASNGIVTVTEETMATGGGRAGSGNPLSAFTMIGEPIGGTTANGTYTIRGGAQMSQPDTTPPDGTISINGGAPSTNTATVTLNLSATDNSGTVAQMRCSNDGATYTVPETYAAMKAWTLTAGDGTKTVYAKFADPAGNWSAAATATILLDTTPPLISAPSASGVTATSASVTWTTNESASSQAEYGLTSGHGASTPLAPSLVTTHTAAITGLSPNTLYHYCVHSQDGAGNLATSADLTLTTAVPDTTPPSGSVVINGGKAATNSPTVTLAVSATDDSGVVSQMQLSNDNVTYSASEAYTTTKSWMLSAGDGAKTVYAKFADAAGNWSSPASASIILDTAPPRITITSPLDGAVLGPQ